MPVKLETWRQPQHYQFTLLYELYFYLVELQYHKKKREAKRLVKSGNGMIWLDSIHWILLLGLVGFRKKTDFVALWHVLAGSLARLLLCKDWTVQRGGAVM